MTTFEDLHNLPDDQFDAFLRARLDRLGAYLDDHYGQLPPAGRVARTLALIDVWPAVPAAIQAVLDARAERDSNPHAAG